MNLSAFFARLLRRSDPILEARDPGVVTLISVVYSTAPKTFAGPATYITVTNGRLTAPAAAATTQAADPTDDSNQSNESSAPTTSSSSSPTTSSKLPTTITPTPAPTTSAAAATTTTPTVGTAKSGMSGGAKAGLAFGILILIGVLLAAILFLYRQRKNKQEGHERLDDEKAFFAAGKPDALPSHATPAPNHGSAPAEYRRPLSFEVQPAPVSLRETAPPVTTSGGLAPPSRNGAAPQLSLRAVSSFEPGISLNPVSSAPNTAAAISASVAAAAASGAALSASSARNGSDASFKSAWEKPGASNAANDPANPFGNHAEEVSPSTRESGLAEIPPPPPSKLINAADFPLPESVPSTPRNFDAPPPRIFDGPAPSPLAAPETPPKTDSTLVPDALVPGAAAATGAAAIAAAVGAAASNKPQGTSNSPAPVAVAAPNPDNVHRVQLEFKPSMGDELEILAGQLVRVLHEYDDGWALCQKMDRSAQGVVPRTCLSKHAVKPRPASPSGGRPQGPPMRNGMPGGPPPFAQPPRPHSAASGRNSPGGRMSPTGRMSPGPGRMSPAPGRASGRNSPAPYAQAPRPLTPTGRARANSSSAPFIAYQPHARSQSPGPNGGSRLRPQESSPAVQRRRSNSMSQVNGTSGLKKEDSPAPAPLSKIPTAGGVARKPVPTEEA